MRGSDVRTESMISYVTCEKRVPAGHPLRAIRTIVDQVLEVLSPVFDRLYSRIGRPSIPPEKLLRAQLLQAFYSVRSARQLMEQLNCNLMFRRCVGMSMDAPLWDVAVFAKNRHRLLDGDTAARLMAAVLGQRRIKALLCDEHFCVDGALIGEPSRRHRFEPDGERGQLEELQAQGWRRGPEIWRRRWFVRRRVLNVQRTQRGTRLPR